MSLVIVPCYDEQPLSTATAFVCHGEKIWFIITNRHNLTGRDQSSGKALAKHGGTPNSLRIFHNKKDHKGSWVAHDEPLFDDMGRRRWFEHPSLKHEADIVALPLTNFGGIDIYPYRLKYPDPHIVVGPSDKVNVIGFPFGITAGGLFPVWSTGFVASEPEVNFDDKPLFLIDCRSRPGQSGSPVIAYFNGAPVPWSDGGSPITWDAPIWRLLGIYSGRVNEQSDLGLVWKTSAIIAIVEYAEGALASKIQNDATL